MQWDQESTYGNRYQHHLARSWHGLQKLAVPYHIAMAKKVRATALTARAQCVNYSQFKCLPTKSRPTNCTDGDKLVPRSSLEPRVAKPNFEQGFLQSPYMSAVTDSMQVFGLILVDISESCVHCTATSLMRSHLHMIPVASSGSFAAMILAA